MKPNIASLALLAVPLLLAGCEEMNCDVVEALPGGPRAVPPSAPAYLGLGDSIVAMNAFECMGIMAYAGLALGSYIEDHSRGGHCLTHPPDGIDIMNQYAHGPWEWVIMNGGGNDMLQDCACSFAGHDPNACQEVMDSIALPAARSGDLFQFIDTVKADTNDTASVLIIGYYNYPESSMEDLDNCNPYVAEMYLRYQQVAEQYERVFLLDTREVMDFDAHPEYFTLDRDHPSYEGSEAMGGMVADFIKNHVPSCTDVDGDGYGDPAGPACTYPERDCDDSNPQIHPGVAENCSNGLDDDCDGLADLEDTECRECTAPEECSDGNPCTDDDCVAFACVHTNHTGLCDDEDPCTMDDTCSGGVCRGEPLDADGDTFVSDACGGSDCDDSNPDVNPGAVEDCFNGTDDDCDGLADAQDSECQECTAAEDCDDGNPCTDDACVSFACVYTNNTGPCDDADPCTMDDTCSGGVCSGDPLDADGDTYVSIACGGADCDDANPDINPGAIEGPAGEATCSDGSDNDCDQYSDEEDSGCTQ